MLIDRIDKRLLKRMFPAGTGEIFYINEDDSDFCDNGNPFWGKTFNDIPLPQWLPFEKFVLHFKNSIVSYTAVRCEDTGCTCGAVGILVDYFCYDSDGDIVSIVPGGDMVVYWLDKSLRLAVMESVDRYTRKQSDIVWESFALPGWEYCLLYYFLCNFLSFLSCKNVKTEFVQPTKGQQRNRRKKKKQPKVSYHVLKIKNTAGSRESSGESGLWSNRIHFCRGHVREYSADKPLFGKLIGKFWIPPHARGDRKLGAVQKDYALGVSQREVRTSL